MVRLLCAALALCALVLAPVGVSLSHPPAEAALAPDLHAHDHGTAQVHADDPAAGHDASDHDQQVRLLSTRHVADPVPGRDGVALTGPIAPPSAIREGPRRPPRLA
jgi:hypothetical protein